MTLRAGTWTVLFTDVVGSTDQRVRLGDAAFDELLREHDTVVARALAAHGGELVEGTGDGAMCAFVGAADALAAAVAIQQRLERRNRDAPEQLHLRVGVSLGDLAFEDGGLHGLAAHEAARVCASAEAGEILVSDVVRSVAGSRAGCELIARGELELKGLPAPVRVWRVAWVAAPEPERLPFPPLLESRRTLAFSGRTGELATVLDAWKGASGGSRGCVVVSGEPGIGKTRLVAEAARVAHGDGAVVLYGRCDDELGVPFQPFAEALDWYVARADEVVAGRWPGDLARIAPQLSGQLRNLPPPLEADPESAQYRLFDAVASWLTTLSAEQPVVLVLDDLQWATKPTLLMLRHVVRATGPARLLVVVTYRETDVSAEHPLQATLAILHQEPGVGSITLDGLDADALGLVLKAAGYELDAAGLELRDTLMAETDGNPFFVGQVLRHLVESGAVTQQDGRWVRSPTADRIGVPDSVRAVIRRRLARLDDEPNAVLTVAAVIGRDFDAELLTTATEMDAELVLDALETAEAGRLIEASSGRAQFRFVHALVRSTLYDDLPTTRRLRLHRRVARALEQHAAGDAYIAELAYHWSAAGQSAPPDKVLGYAIAAGDAAQQRLAPDEAVRWYTHALELIDRLDPATRDEQRCAVLLHLGTAQRLAGRPEFGQTLLDAAHLAQRLGDTDRLVDAALTNTRGFTSHMWRLDDERLAVLRAALDAIGTSSPGLRARLLAQWAIETMHSPGYDNEALIAEALTLTETSDDPTARLRALSALCSKAIPHNLEQRRACQAELLELASPLDPSQQCGAFSHSCVQAVQAGELVEAQRFLDEMNRTAQASGDPTLRWMAEAYAAALSASHGDHSAAEQHANAALRLGIEAAQPDALQVHGALLTDIRRIQGREADLYETTAQLVMEYPGLPVLRGALAWQLAASGRNDEARAILDDLVVDVPSLWVDRVWATTLAVCTDAAALIGHTAMVRSVVPLLAPFAHQWIFNGGNGDGPVALVLGIARTVCADYGHADADFEHALAMAEHAGSLYWAARAQLEWAIMLCQRNHSDDQRRASRILRESLHTAAEYGYAGIECRGTSLAVE